MAGGCVRKFRLLSVGGGGVGDGDECGIKGVFADVDPKHMRVVFVIGGG
jgi:hypothetical protein